MRLNISCTLILFAVFLTESPNPETRIFIYEGRLKSNETDFFLFRIGPARQALIIFFSSKWHPSHSIHWHFENNFGEISWNVLSPSLFQHCSHNFVCSIV
uniref:Secreted protein n=1 Tax=Ixodes ricinus TaxID=34613 RepID=A0A0K8RME1_IXORI